MDIETMSPLDTLRQTVFALYARGAERRTGNAADNVRSYNRDAKVWDLLGEFIGASFAGSIKPDVKTFTVVNAEGQEATINRDTATDEWVPSIVFRLSKVGSKRFVELVDVIAETEGISLTKANAEYMQPRSFGVIGYDTEFLPDPKVMLSHQFCFDVGEGRRFGVILDTDIRFTDNTLLEFLKAVVLNLKKCLHKHWYIFAHFSLVEGSWVDSSGEKLILRERKQWKGDLSLATRPVLRQDGKPSMTKDKKTGEMVQKQEKIWITFADTMNLDPRSLKAGAEGCGLKKYAVFPQKYEARRWFNRVCGRIYEKIDRWKRLKPDEFYRYGARDAIITAGIPIVLHSKFGTDAAFQVRTAKYSERHMFDWFKNNYTGIHQGWQSVLGQHQLVIPSSDPEKEPFVKWEPDKFQQHVLKDWYKGGRNEARQVGCFEHPVSYFDMTSAYPTALAALTSDFDFSRLTVRTRNDGAVERIEQLWQKGPFQPHALKAYIRFRPECKAPMAPISTDAGIIYPLENDGQIVCWPEYWAAKELDIIEEEFVLTFYEFEALSSRHLPDYILEMIKKRNEDKVFYKSILNYLSGKLAQGRRPKMPYSSITCPGLAAYLTSAIRAAAAEIGNLNEYYAITTDGIISPVEKLKYGAVNDQLKERLAAIDFEWMKNEFTGDKTIVWKTRGYILVDSSIDPDKEPEKKRFKQAKMGLQGEEPVDFVKQIKTGKGIRRSVTSFAKLNDGEVFSFMEKEFNINPNFDFKYAIVPETVVERSIEIDGVELQMPCFNTRPLRNMNEHYTLRRICDWRVLKKVLTKQSKKFDSKELLGLIETATLNDGRCRHMVWEFRKRMARMIDPRETTQHLNTIRALWAKPLYPIPAKYGDIENFRAILEREVVDITDVARRAEVLDAVIEQMKAARSGEPVNLDVPEWQAEYQQFLEVESYRDEAENVD